MSGIGSSIAGPATAMAQNIEPLLTAPAFVISMVIVPLAATAWLLVTLWRDTTRRRRALAALAACMGVSLGSFLGAIYGSGPLTAIWGLIFLATFWWCALALMLLLWLSRRWGR